MLMQLVHLLIFPGLLFLISYSFILSFVDRRINARLQNRKGPPWYQPLADLLKLLGKETIIPIDAEKKIFSVLPIVSLAAVATAFVYIPTWSIYTVHSFQGDLILVLYLLTIPTLCSFLAGWYSSSIYATIGAVRTLTQLFAYEVPLFMAMLSPALLADSWSITEITQFFSDKPLFLLINIPGLIVALIACQGKLQRVPFDLPEADTELAGGTLVEYTGRLFAMFKLSADCEMVVVCSLLVSVFMPVSAPSFLLGFLYYILETMLLLFILALFRSVMARVRIEQMDNFCWRFLTPLALVQIVINLIIKGVLL